MHPYCCPVSFAGTQLFHLIHGNSLAQQNLGGCDKTVGFCDKKNNSVCGNAVMCYLDRLLLSQRQKEGLHAGFLHFWQHLRLKWPTRWFCLPKWKPGMCTWVNLCACVHESTVVKRCWLSLHTCLHLQDRPVCLCERVVCHCSSGVRVFACMCVAVFVQRCFGLRALTHRSSLKAARRMCALDCDHWQLWGPLLLLSSSLYLSFLNIISLFSERGHMQSHSISHNCLTAKTLPY